MILKVSVKNIMNEIIKKYFGNIKSIIIFAFKSDCTRVKKIEATMIKVVQLLFSAWLCYLKKL